MNLPLIRRLRQNFPNAHLSFLADRSLGALMSFQRDLDEIVPFDPSSLRAFGREGRLYSIFRKGRYDCVVISNPHKLMHLAALWARIPLRIGFDRKWGFCLNRRIPDRKSELALHEIDYDLALADTICHEPWDRSFGLDFVEGASEGPWEKYGLDPSAKFIAFHTGSSNPRKEWPYERFGSVIEEVLQWGMFGVVLLGEGDPIAALHRMGLRDNPRLHNLMGRTSLVDLARILLHAACLVSVDSGPYHLAWIQKTPVVGIFLKDDPGSSPRRWGVYPGFSRCVELYDVRDRISSDDVVEAVRKIMHAQRPVKA